MHTRNEIRRISKIHTWGDGTKGGLLLLACKVNASQWLVLIFCWAPTLHMHHSVPHKNGKRVNHSKKCRQSPASFGWATHIARFVGNFRLPEPGDEVTVRIRDLFASLTLLETGVNVIL